MTESRISRVETDEVIAPVSNYSNGIVVEGGRTLHISGQVGVGPDMKMKGDGSVEDQARTTFENVIAVARAAGGGKSNIVSMTIYVKNEGDMQAVSDIRSEVFDADPFPASTMIAGASFVAPFLLVEVSAIAAL